MPSPPEDAFPRHLRSPTIHDVAAALGMHKSTVSLALSGKGNVSSKTRARVAQVALEMGYQPSPLAQRLAAGMAKNLVCLCAGDLDVGITTSKILLLQKALRERGLDAPIYTMPTATVESTVATEEKVVLSAATQLRHLCRLQPRAIVCSAQAFHPAMFPELAHYTREGGIVVSYDVEIPLECDQVVFDREDNAYQAVRHLISHGHREIGLALSALQRADGHLDQPQAARLQGFKRALKEAGLEFHPEWVWKETSYEIGGANLARHYLHASRRPTGICVVNDYMALAFMAEVQRAGVQIPQDLSVMGHDNQAVAPYCSVPLSAVTQPQSEIVQAVINLLDERLQGSTAAPRTVVIRGQIIERQSVAAPSR